MKWQDGVTYATKVIKGEVKACHNVQLACQRFLNQLENKEWEWQFIPEAVEHFLAFTSMLKHTKGPDAGKPLILEPFQVFTICSIYGFRHKADHSKRMVSDVIIFIPRKAGKSTLIAAIGLYELQFGEAGSEVYTLATTRDQASIVFTAAVGFIEAMPSMLAKSYNVGRSQITKVGDSQSMLRALSRDTKKTGDGMNPSCAIIDEAAQIVDRNSIEVLHSGMVARKNPLRIYITTASFTKDTKFYEDMVMMESMLNGTAKDNPRWFGLLYGIDQGDDWSDPAMWSKANPMHGISVYEEAIQQRVEEARSKPALLNEVLCKTFNVWVSANSAWVNRQAWDEPQCVITKPTPDHEATFIGIDLSFTRDLNAIAKLNRFSDGTYEAFFQCFLPEDSIEHVPTHYKPIYHQAIERGTLKLTRGNVMDGTEIADYIIKTCQTETVTKIGFDAYNAASVVSRLLDHGLPAVKVGQSMAALNNPSKEVEKLILSGKIRHIDDPFIGWCLGNCEVYTDVNANIKVRKNEADYHAKVDPIIAMIIAMYCSLDNPQAGYDYLRII